MADTKLSALTELAATPATGDEIYIRDISESAADESKRITIANLQGGVLADLEDDTSPQLGGNLDMQARLLVGNGGSTGIAISAAGEVTMAAQPCVLAHNSSTDDNQTGNGGTATVDFDTEVFDQGGDFASDTFTAPITGRYLLQAQVCLISLAAAMTRGNIIITSSNRSYERDMQFGGATDDNSIHCSVVADMDAADTVTVTVRVFNGSGDSAGVLGYSTIPFTFFSACLLA
jgi:hypothetical protein